MAIYYITLAVIVNHFLLAFLLFTASKISGLANKLLASQIICVASLHFLTISIFWHNNSVYKHIVGIEYIIGASLGPLIYLYVICYLREKMPWGFKLYQHFIITGIFLLIVIVVHTIPNLNNELANIRGKPYSLFVYSSDSICFISIISYLFYSYYLYRKNLSTNDQKRVRIYWLSVYFKTTAVTAIIVIPMGFIKNGDLAGMYMPIVTFFYYFVLFWQFINTSKILTNEKTESLPLNFNGLDKQTIHCFFTIHKPYLNENLSLEILAEQMGIPKNQLSRYINNQLNTNFFSFINTYRINYAKNILTNQNYKNYKINSIARMSGFKSRTSFYDEFKKQEGISPTEYRIKQEKSFNF